MANPKNPAPEAQGTQQEGDNYEGWIKVQDHRPMYMPKDTGMQAIQGYMLGTVEMNPSAKNLKKDLPLEDQYWIAVVFLLTKTCKLRSPEKDFRDYPPGTQCLVGGADLASLHLRADDPRRCFEVRIKPTTELALGGGFRMMLFDKIVNPTTVPRNPGTDYEFLEGRTAERMGDPFNAPQLAQGNAQQASPQAVPQVQRA
jgi:hypothetical protein